MKKLPMRMAAGSLCMFLIACGSDSDNSFDAPVAPLPAELIGVWGEVADDAQVEAAAAGQTVNMLIHDAGLGTSDGRLRVLITISEEREEFGFFFVAEYFGELILEGDAISGRLNYLAADDAPIPQLVPQDEFILLSGVAVDSDTLSFVLETETGQGADAFGTQEFFLSKLGELSPETENPLLEFAGTFEATPIAVDFLGSTYVFRITFPSDTGEGFGTIAGDCDVEIALQPLGAELPSQYTRLRVLSCADNDPYAGPVEFYGYSIVIAPFDPARPLIRMLLGSDTETIQLVGVRPVM